MKKLFLIALIIVLGLLSSPPQDSRAGEVGPLASLQNIVSIAAGNFHTCAIDGEDQVICWGNNAYGQLGNNTTTQSNRPVNVSGISSISAIAAGAYHTCALTAGGGVVCWGLNNYGQLGDGTTTQRNTPVNVQGLSTGVAAITAGDYHTCALTTGGGIKCWGYNENGQLGDGTTTQRNAPVDVTGLTSGVASITAGYYHTCARTTTGGAKCWGANWHGELGNGTTNDQDTPTPVDVTGLSSGVSAIAAGFYHTCALTTGGGVKCWGYNYYGQLGDGTTDQHTTPTDVSDLTSGVNRIAVGGFHTCAVTTGGGAKCWGNNEYGQIGNGEYVQKETPVDVIGLSSGVNRLIAGYSHSCALLTSGNVKCWGANGSGQVGSGTNIEYYNTPVDVAAQLKNKLYLPLITKNFH